MTIKQRFLNYLLLEKNCSERTVRSYDLDLNLFESYFRNLDARLSWESVDSDVIRDWIESMMDRGNNATSINRRLSALRSFYRFALSRNLIDNDPARGVEGPKKQRALPRFVKEGEMDVLLASFENMERSYDNVLAHAVMLTFYWTGLRVSELIGLNDGDIDWLQHKVKVTGKRDKQRIVPFGEEPARVLGEYAALRDACVKRIDNAFFVTEKGTRVTYYNIRKIVDRSLGGVSTLSRRNPHVMRHTYATAMLNNGAGIESVRKLLGHDSVATTEIYTHVTFEKLKETYEAAHPRS